MPGAARPIADVVADALRVFECRVRRDHPRFYGFIPSPASPASPASPLSLVGDMLTTGFNAHAGSWMQSSDPAAIEQGLIAGWHSGGKPRKRGITDQLTCAGRPGTSRAQCG